MMAVLIQRTFKALSCRADSHPPALVTWHRAGAQLPLPSPGGQLRLPGIGRTQAGEYLCQAENSQGLSRAAKQVDNTAQATLHTREIGCICQ